VNQIKFTIETGYSNWQNQFR